MNDVVVRSQAALAQSIDVRGVHQLCADEPNSAGGQDTGPNPYELLLSALGACTAMTVRLYAQRKGWPLDSIEVALQHKRVYAQDCADCETQNGYLDHTTKNISMHGALTSEQRQRLLDISERCPVQRTLQHTVRIETRFTPGD